MDRVCTAKRQVKAERESERRRKGYGVWKRKELIRHSAFISCDLQVRAPTTQRRLNSKCNGFRFRSLPNAAHYLTYQMMKTSETLLFLQQVEPTYTEKAKNVQLQLLISVPETSGNNMLP